jgi:hypothetical protein
VHAPIGSALTPAMSVAVHGTAARGHGRRLMALQPIVHRLSGPATTGTVIDDRNATPGTRARSAKTARDTSLIVAVAPAEAGTRADHALAPS